MKLVYRSIDLPVIKLTVFPFLDELQQSKFSNPATVISWKQAKIHITRIPILTFFSLSLITFHIFSAQFNFENVLFK